MSTSNPEVSVMCTDYIPAGSAAEREAGAEVQIDPAAITLLRERAAVASQVFVDSALLLQLLDERERMRLEGMNLLRQLDRMGGTVTEGHSRNCNIWKGGQCGCRIAFRIAQFQEAIGYGKGG